MNFLSSYFNIEILKQTSFWGNTVYDYFLALVIFVGVILALKIFKSFILIRLKKLSKKTKTDFDDILVTSLQKVKSWFYIFVALFFAVKVLVLSELVATVLNILILVAVVYEVVKTASRFVDYLVNKVLKSKQTATKDKKYSRSMLQAISIILKAVLWIVAIILILSNLGINVTSLIASLGIGGIAIALALQNILTDIFSSFSLYVDKPFEIGDFIAVGGDSGTVERIGLKTTRIRTLQGEELVISNKELTTARVQNFKRLEQRRVVVNLGVIYETSQTKLKAIPSITKRIIKDIKGVDFDRCHFESFGDFSLNFELVYLVNSDDYADYMEKKQEINLAIFKEFEKEKIEFAYPTQVIVLNKSE
ncbi:MAG TPA: mechanosensitive ion channel family protein [Patescibacteria group bacterium]|nr:mechanosensitive ion channel family protein [Patescibacteria group bacterium]